jgi:hypothetical protein
LQEVLVKDIHRWQQCHHLSNTFRRSPQPHE